MATRATAVAGAAGVDLDGRVFAPVGAGESARGRFSQHGTLVRSEISGGSVRAGSMVGSRLPDGSIDAVYCLALDGGELVAGRRHYVPTLLPDGRIRMAEHWHRLDGSAGVSYIEEVPGRGRTA